MKKIKALIATPLYTIAFLVVILLSLIFNLLVSFAKGIGDFVFETCDDIKSVTSIYGLTVLDCWKGEDE